MESGDRKGEPDSLGEKDEEMVTDELCEEVKLSIDERETEGLSLELMDTEAQRDMETVADGLGEKSVLLESVGVAEEFCDMSGEKDSLGEVDVEIDTTANCEGVRLDIDECVTEEQSLELMDIAALHDAEIVTD